MGVSKVVYGNDTLVDLTGDTVTPTSLTLGATAHGADGEPIVGEYQYTLPVASPTTRGGARIQPDSGLEITDTDNLQVRLALESDGTVRGGIAELTAKGHAEQDGTPTPDNPVSIQVVRGRNLLSISDVSDAIGLTLTKQADGGIHIQGTPTSSGNIILWEDVENPVTLNENGYLSVGVVTSSQYTVGFGTTSDRYAVTVSTGTSGVLIPQGTYSSLVVYVSISNTYDITFYPQLTLGSTPQPYVPYGHVGMECGGSLHGRNLFRGNRVLLQEPIPRGSHIVASAYTSGTEYVRIYRADGTLIDYWMLDVVAGQDYKARKFNLSEDVYSVSFDNYDGTYNVQIEHNNGTGKPTEYDPWFFSTTPIPLPQRGWVGSLPDGTADSLRLDGAGHAEWTLPTSMETFDGSSDEGWFDSYERFATNLIASLTARPASNAVALVELSNSYIDTYSNAVASTDGTFGTSTTGTLLFKNVAIATFEAWAAALSSNPVTVLYPLATPVTEDCGYVEDWPTDIPEGAVLDIPELSEVGIKFFIDSSVTELAKQWYARAYAELGDAVTELAGRVAALES